MVDRFPTRELGDIAELFDSLHQTPRYANEGYPMIRVTDIRRGSVDTTSAVRVDEETYLQFSKKHRPQVGDILFSRVGSYGNSSYVSRNEQFCLGQNTVCITPEQSRIQPTFLYCALNSDNLRNQIEALVGGASQGTISLKSIRKLQIPSPPLPVQQRIAGVLSAYDELIANSQRRINILESMARALYREWFVHFRFPGHEKRPRVASPLGEIPQGWEVKRVTDAVHVNPRVVVPREGEKPFVPMGCLSTDSMLISEIESRTGNSGSKFQNGDTLFARITPCLENGKTGLVQFMPNASDVAFGSTEFIVLRSRSLTPEFVYCLARSDEFRGVAIKSMSGATGRQRVQEKCFGDFQIAHPPQELLGQFSAIVSPSFRLIYSLHQQIQNLRRTRDLLLPRLLSGQVALDALDT
jgi:type I restriction enzyme, S subunit